MAKKSSKSEMQLGRDYTEQDLEFVYALKTRPANKSMVSVFRDVYGNDYKDGNSESSSLQAKLKSQHITTLMEDFDDRMESMADLALDVSEDIMRSGRSEKVKADLAIEFIRQRAGAPVQKNINANVSRVVHVTVSD